MLGRTHVLSGAVGLNIMTAVPVTSLHPGLTARCAGTVIAAGSAALCDLDSCGSTAARAFGPVTRLLAKLIAVASHGHREGTHSITGIAVFTGYAAATVACLTAPTMPVRITAGIMLAVLLAVITASMLQALHLARHATADLIAITAAITTVTLHADIPGLAGIPAGVGIGVAAHIAGDMLTTHGCPLLWPFTERCFWLLPRPLRFRTGTWPEHLIAVALLITLGWFAWHCIIG